MTLAKRVLPEVESDIDFISEYYENEKEGVGTRFILAAFEAMDATVEYPERHALVHPPVRVVRLNKFPHGVLFIVEDDEVVVLAVQDLRRSPRQRFEQALRRMAREVE